MKTYVFDVAERTLQHAEQGMRLTVRVDYTRCTVATDCDYPSEGED